MPLPAGHPCCEIRRSDAGFVIIADEAAGDVFLNDFPSAARVVADSDQIGAGGALMLWREEVVHEASGNGRPRQGGRTEQRVSGPEEAVPRLGFSARRSRSLIAGVGTDIIEIGRIREFAARGERYLRRVFTRVSLPRHPNAG